MDIYRILRLYQRIRSPRIKLLGILALHLSHRRYINMTIDPVLGCNLQCRMCYFSDPEVRRTMHGKFTPDDLEAIGHSLFHRVLKLQIGCGAEPTIFKHLPELVKLAADKGIPNISITTNGNLLDEEKLRQLAENGLTELTLSAHGLTREVYEDMMQGASFDRFLQTLEAFHRLQASLFPQLRLRINYTINQDNLADLKLLPQLFKQIQPAVIQLRPIQKIGNSTYKNFAMEPILQRYDECIRPVVDFCQQNNITCIYPEKHHLNSIDQNEDSRQHLNQLVDLLPYFQLAPFENWKEKINPYSETFEQYCQRTHRVRFILKSLLGIGKATTEEATKVLNYSVD